MNGAAKEWVTKAEADFATARRERLARKNPNFDAACFHAQQCIEKLMKALLIRIGSTPPKTHDLVYLDTLLSKVCPDWCWPVEELRFVSRAAVAFRYPGESACREEAIRSVTLADHMRKRLLELLNACG